MLQWFLTCTRHEPQVRISKYKQGVDNKICAHYVGSLSIHPFYLTQLYNNPSNCIRWSAILIIIWYPWENSNKQCKNYVYFNSAGCFILHYYSKFHRWAYCDHHRLQWYPWASLSDCPCATGHGIEVHIWGTRLYGSAYWHFEQWK